MKSITLTYHSDPGHGWLEVPQSLIPATIIQQISRYSYRDKSNYYFEEDDDMNKALKFLQKSYNVNVTDKSYNNECFIRDLRSIK